MFIIQLFLFHESSKYKLYLEGGTQGIKNLQTKTDSGTRRVAIERDAQVRPNIENTYCVRPTKTTPEGKNIS